MKPIDQHSSELMCLQSNHQNRYTEKLTSTLKIVKNEYIYEVASLKFSTLLDKLELLHSCFFQGSRWSLPNCLSFFEIL